MTDLEVFISRTPLADTHEHLPREKDYTSWHPDVLSDLFGGYTATDLIAAGATEEAVKKACDRSDPDVTARFAGIRSAWELCQHTGFGQATRLTARLAYEIEEISLPRLQQAHAKFSSRDFRGERMRLLKHVAGLEHIQVDLMNWETQSDVGEEGFVFYDLSIRDFATGGIALPSLEQTTGREIKDLATLECAMEALFSQRGSTAIAVKTQHAYDRSLAWSHREDADAEVALLNVRKSNANAQDKLCLGDWCLDKAIGIATRHQLPVKIHTGYLARNGYMQLDETRVALLCPLLARHPHAKFVLMHMAAGHEHELLAIAKHYPNVYVDLCWAWAISPRAAGRFVQDYIHMAPTNRLFAFGGDTTTPTTCVAFAHQARNGLAAALSSEVHAGNITENDAIAIADRLMRLNQRAAFDIEGRSRAAAAP